MNQRREIDIFFLLRLCPLLILIGIFIPACDENTTAPTDGNSTIDVDNFDFSMVDTIVYSRHIQPIFTQKCALSGCHAGTVPKQGLSLETYEGVLAGSDFIQALVPFNSEKSHMIEHLEGEALPRMPFELPPLKPTVIAFIARWIDGGAPNDDGVIPFSDLSRKIYVTNQGDDLVSIIDPGTNNVVRLIEVGSSENLLEVPHNITIDAAGEFWYVTLISVGELWKFDAAVDTFIAKAAVDLSPAHVIVSPDGAKAYVTNWDQTEQFPTVHIVDTRTMTVTQILEVGTAPHGINFSPNGEFIYVTNHNSDNVSIIDAVTLEELARVSLGVTPTRQQFQPLQVVFSPSSEFAYVSCFRAAFSEGEVKVIDTQSQSVVRTITVGRTPFLLNITPDGGQVWVANRGSSSISIINTSVNNVIATIENGSDNILAQPHGIVFSKDGSLAYVTNENISGDIPPHHPTTGGGTPGSVTVIDTQTFEVVRVIEVEVDPTGIVIRE